MIRFDPMPLSCEEYEVPEGGMPRSYKAMNPPRGLSVKIFNGTDFNTSWLHRYIMMCAKEAEINWKIYFWFVDDGWSDEYAWIGTSNCFDEFICQITDKVLFPLSNEIENEFINKHALCKFIIAHELCHATYGHPENFIDHDEKMENCCNYFAMEMARRK